MNGNGHCGDLVPSIGSIRALIQAMLAAESVYRLANVGKQRWLAARHVLIRGALQVFRLLLPPLENLQTHRRVDTVIVDDVRRPAVLTRRIGLRLLCMKRL